MRMPRLTCVPAIAIATLCLSATVLVSTVAAQNHLDSAPIRVDQSVSSVELITKTSRLLHFDYDVPELVIDNQSVLRATPIAADKVLLTALKPGFATITASDANNQTQTITVMVRGDVRALELALKQFFPSSTVRATALETGVILSGTLARGDDVEGAVQVASEYFPKVYNNIRLPDSQMIAIEVQVYEVARTKARELGLDWELFTSDLSLEVSGALNTSNNLLFSVVDDGNRLNGFLQALERRSLARLMDKPILVTQNGRPAEFLQGGELPFSVPQGLGAVAIEFRPFGTKLDVVPIVQGEGTIRLEVRAEISEPDQSLANGSGVSGFRVRRVNTGVDMKVGHTLALAGDLREEVEAEVRGIPGLMNLPYIGRGFSRVQETKQEVELVMLLTPRFVGEVDPSLMPACKPGRSTVSPSDCQLYRDGYIEVPRCGPDCAGLPNQPAGGLGTGYGFALGDQPGSSVPIQPANFNRQPAPGTPPGNPANRGFGYPTPGNADQPAPRTGSLSLKKLFRR